MIPTGEGVPNQALELESTSLTLVVNLVIQSFLDIGIHAGMLLKAIGDVLGSVAG